MSIDSNRLGARLTAQREKIGLSITAAAEKAKIAKSYLAKLEKGEVENPGLATLGAIAKALDITLAYLLESERPRTPTKPQAVEIPPSLQEFVASRRKQGDKVSEELVAVLAQIPFRGARPSHADDWYFIYEALKRGTRER